MLAFETVLALWVTFLLRFVEFYCGFHVANIDWGRLRDTWAAGFLNFAQLKRWHDWNQMACDRTTWDAMENVFMVFTSQWQFAVVASEMDRLSACNWTLVGGTLNC